MFNNAPRAISQLRMVFIFCVSSWLTGFAAYGLPSEQSCPSFFSDQVLPQEPKPSGRNSSSPLGHYVPILVGPALLTTHPIITGQKQDFMLPFLGKIYLPTSIGKRSQHPPALLTPLLTGGIYAESIEDQFAKRLDELIDIALNKGDQFDRLNQRVAHFRGTPQRAIAKGKDVANYMIPYRGFGPSRQAADVILDEPIEIDSEDAAAYARQRLVDETHPRVVKAVIQIAMGIGTTNLLQRTAIVDSGKSSLRDLVGQEETEKTATLLKRWGEDVSIPESTWKQPAWDIETRDEKVSDLIHVSLDNDEVVKEVVRRLHKYNRHSKLAEKASGLIESTLSAGTWLSPGLWLQGVCGLAGAGFILATGGSEEDKLLKEVYLDKRMESRWQAISSEANLAINGYQLALLQRNPHLLICTQAVTTALAGDIQARQILEPTFLTLRKTIQDFPQQTNTSQATLIPLAQ